MHRQGLKEALSKEVSLGNDDPEIIHDHLVQFGCLAEDADIVLEGKGVETVAMT